MARFKSKKRSQCLAASKNRWNLPISLANPCTSMKFTYCATPITGTITNNLLPSPPMPVQVAVDTTASPIQMYTTTVPVTTSELTWPTATSELLPIIPPIPASSSLTPESTTYPLLPVTSTALPSEYTTNPELPVTSAALPSEYTTNPESPVTSTALPSEYTTNPELPVTSTALTSELPEASEGSVSNHYSTAGNRIVSLTLLGTYIQEITNHAAACGHGLQFLGESKRIGLCSVLASRCYKCKQTFKTYTSECVKFQEKGHYSTNLGAVLGQISTGGGGDHLEEQLSSMNVPSLSPHTFVSIERSLGTAFEDIVTKELLSAGREEREHAITNNKFFEGVPACTVVVDAGWSKRSHKHSYNANSGVGVIFGAYSKKLLYIGIHNKYCSTCSVAQRSSDTIPPHKCYKNWSQSSCAMESDIIVEGFRCSERMHGLRYMWMIGDVCKRRASFAPLTVRLLYVQCRETPQMRYGRVNEPHVREQYILHLKNNHHPDASVSTTGIYVDLKDGWLGASPDGLVYDPSFQDPDGLLEIKCPAQASETTVDELCATNPGFFLEKCGDKYSLKQRHNYYYQVQGQMHITKRKWCDLVVWNPQAQDKLIITRIDYEDNFWKSSMFPKLKHFYLGSMLPELASPRYPTTKAVRETRRIDI